MALIDSIISAESGGNPNARNPNSSAMGAGQFLASTWLDMVSRHRPDLVQGKSPEEILALRSDPQLSREMTEAYAAQNGRTLAQSGFEATPGNTYLAHFAGPKGAVSVLSADPSAPVASILGPEAVKANPFLAKMTAGDLQAWAAKKMGGSAPAAQPPQASPAAPANGLLAGAAPPLQFAPQPNPPLFEGVRQGPPMGPMGNQTGGLPAYTPTQQGGDIFSQMPAMAEPSPIFFAPRRAPDLRNLRASLKAPIFKRG